MLLSNRLEKIAYMVDPCESIADIGTDHGYIPIYLIKSGICKYSIASDINKGPVEKAIKNIKLEGLENKIECRLGAGLETLKNNEVQGVVIAGMGGHLIKDIIEDGKEIINNLSYAILQPVQHAEVLRKYLYNSGYFILDEELCFEDDKFYEIIKVKSGNTCSQLDEIYYEISPTLIKKKHKLLESFINFKIERNSKIITSLNENTENVSIRKRLLIEKNKQLREILLCL